jgi:undecaprenyl-diphosphatase
LPSFLYSLDAAVFRWINEGWSNPIFDSFFTFVTDIRHYWVPIAVLLVYWIWRGGPKGRWLVFSLVLAVLLSDQTASHVVKGWVERIRPCNALDGVLTPGGKSGAYSFPSSHAANMGSSMFLLSMAFRPWTWLFVLIALLVGFSRVYLGLHYPSDVLGGYGLGLLIGVGVWWGVEKLKEKYIMVIKGFSLPPPLAGEGTLINFGNRAKPGSENKGYPVFNILRAKARKKRKKQGRLRGGNSKGNHPRPGPLPPRARVKVIHDSPKGLRKNARKKR